MDYPKTSGNLLETYTAGFRRFPDNPSLTDHTVDLNLRKCRDKKI
jgi:hypothetical protein